MAIPVLLILAVLWAAVLLPPLFRARSERRHGDSITDFRHRLGVIGKTGGFRFHREPPARVLAPPVVAGSRHRVAAGASGARRGGTARGAGLPGGPRAQRRRQQVLVALGGAVLVTLVAAVFSGSTAAWGLQLVFDLLLAGYLVLLARTRALALERHDKVRYLPGRVPAQLALRRSASS